MAGTENTKASELLHTPGGKNSGKFPQAENLTLVECGIFMAVLVPESWRYSIR